MLDFHSKEIKSKVLSRFMESIHKSIKYVSDLLLIYKIEMGSKLDKKLMIYLWFWLVKIHFLNNLKGKRFFWSFWFFDPSKFGQQLNIVVCESKINSKTSAGQ